VNAARLVEEITARLSLRFGPGIAAWCATVPALAQEIAARWDLKLDDAYPDGASSVALRCSRADGAGAVLKLSPDPPFLADQADMLRRFAPGGRVPAVLAVDAAAGAVLLESIEPGTGADELAQPPSPQEWGQLVRALHCAAAPPDFPRDLRGRCDEFFARIGRRLAEPHIGQRVRPADLDRGADRYSLLLATAPSRVLLHGDLHLGNVLDGGPARGLVAIDPGRVSGIRVSTPWTTPWTAPATTASAIGAPPRPRPPGWTPTGSMPGAALSRPSSRSTGSAVPARSKPSPSC
jgi:streptomycin 6-kinase